MLNSKNNVLKSFDDFKEPAFMALDKIRDNLKMLIQSYGEGKELSAFDQMKILDFNPKKIIDVYTLASLYFDVFPIRDENGKYYYKDYRSIEVLNFGFSNAIYRKITNNEINSVGVDGCIPFDDPDSNTGVNARVTLDDLSITLENAYKYRNYIKNELEVLCTAYTIYINTFIITNEKDKTEEAKRQRQETYDNLMRSNSEIGKHPVDTFIDSIKNDIEEYHKKIIDPSSIFENNIENNNGN